MRFADRLNYFMGVDCRACGHGMPGRHGRNCRVRRAALNAEKKLPNSESQQALVRVLHSMMERIPLDPKV